MTQRLWVIAYDIVDDPRRLRVERALHNVGERVQWSVFEVFLTPLEARALIQRLADIIDPTTDDLRAWPLCRWCQDHVDMHGLGRRSTDPEVIVL